MIRISNFGINQELDFRFEEKRYHHNTKENIAFRIELQDLANSDNYLYYNTKVRTEFENIEKDKTENLGLMRYNLERLEDLAMCLSYCIPERYIQDERYRYDFDKITRRTTQLDFRIAYEIIDLQKRIITILSKNTKFERIKLVEPLPRTPINYETAFIRVYKPEIVKIEKKRGFFAWLK